MKKEKKVKDRSGRAAFPLAVGFVALAALVGGFGYWSVTARIAGAVVSSGMIRVENHRQVVQHPEGGVVGAILAKNGDFVETGQTLIRFDDARLRSELKVVEGKLYEIRARSARLEAERDGLDKVIFPEDLVNIAKTEPSVADQIAGQSRQFLASQKALEQESELLREQITQIENRILGTRAQLDALRSQKALIAEELKNQKTLLGRGLTQAARVMQLSTEQASIMGEIGKLNADIAEFKGLIASIKIELVKLRTGQAREAISTLRDIQYTEIELAERRAALVDTLSRLDVKAPVSGIVFGTNVFALKSVVQPGAPIMYIIPQDQPLLIAARVDTNSIDQVRLGQEVALRFTVFDQRRTPELEGYVSRISADVITDEATGLAFYAVDILPGDGELGKLGEEVVLPGMPVEAFIKTGERSPMAFLTKPLTDYFARAFRG